MKARAAGAASIAMLLLHYCGRGEHRGNAHVPRAQSAYCVCANGGNVGRVAAGVVDGSESEGLSSARVVLWNCVARSRRVVGLSAKRAALGSLFLELEQLVSGNAKLDSRIATVSYFKLLLVSLTSSVCTPEQHIQ